MLNQTLMQMAAGLEDYVDWLTEINHSVMSGFDEHFPDAQSVMDWAESSDGEAFFHRYPQEAEDARD